MSWRLLVLVLLCVAAVHCQDTLVRTSRVLGDHEVALLRELGVNVSRYYSSHVLGRTVLTVSGAIAGTAASQVWGQNVVLEDDVAVQRAPVAPRIPRSTAADNTTDSLRSTGSWALDRIDQRASTLDGVFNPSGDGDSTDVYIVDTGIQIDHYDFGGRARHDFSAFPTYEDCDGHGTHVAGLAGGVRWGAASQASLHSVRVLDCQGSGTLSGVVQGMMWIHDNRRPRSVINLSLGIYANVFSLSEVVKDLAVAGVLMVAAAGNGDRDACGHYPSGYDDVISVGATNAVDRRAYFSNYGAACVDIMAPGEDVRSSWIGDSTRTISGTSMASPLVAGALAVLRSQGMTATQARVELLSGATSGYLRDDTLNGSPNRLLYIGTDAPVPSPPPPRTPSSSRRPAAGGSGGAPPSSASTLSRSTLLLLLVFTLWALL